MAMAHFAYEISRFWNEDDAANAFAVRLNAASINRVRSAGWFENNGILCCKIYFLHGLNCHDDSNGN